MLGVKEKLERHEKQGRKGSLGLALVESDPILPKVYNFAPAHSCCGTPRKERQFASCEQLSRVKASSFTNK